MKASICNALLILGEYLMWDMSVLFALCDPFGFDT